MEIVQRLARLVGPASEVDRSRDLRRGTRLGDEPRAIVDREEDGLPSRYETTAVQNWVEVAPYGMHGARHTEPATVQAGTLSQVCPDRRWRTNSPCCTKAIVAPWRPNGWHQFPVPSVWLFQRTIEPG